MPSYLTIAKVATIDDDTVRCWVGIAALLRKCNARLYRSRMYVSEITQNGTYVSILPEPQQAIREWAKNFDSSKRMLCYINSVERMLMTASSIQANENCSGHGIWARSCRGK